MEYANYDYYENTYLGDLTSDLFSSYILKASKQIDKNVNLILTDEIIALMTDLEQDNLKYATCEMVDLLYGYRTVDGNIRDVESLSIDGVKKVYRSAAELKTEIDTKKTVIINGLPQEIIRYA